MGLVSTDWQSNILSAQKTCKVCGSWKNHWISNTNLSWPNVCSVDGCLAAPTVGAIIKHAEINAERIIPICEICYQNTKLFNLKNGVIAAQIQEGSRCVA